MNSATRADNIKPSNIDLENNSTAPIDNSILCKDYFMDAVKLLRKVRKTANNNKCRYYIGKEIYGEVTVFLSKFTKQKPKLVYEKY
jgi:hypothetical protein